MRILKNNFKLKLYKYTQDALGLAKECKEIMPIIYLHKELYNIELTNEDVFLLKKLPSPNKQEVLYMYIFNSSYNLIVRPEDIFKDINGFFPQLNNILKEYKYTLDEIKEVFEKIDLIYKKNIRLDDRYTQLCKSERYKHLSEKYYFNFGKQIKPISFKQFLMKYLKQ